MQKITKHIVYCTIGLQFIFLLPTPADAHVSTKECSSGNGASVCQESTVAKKRTETNTGKRGGESIQDDTVIHQPAGESEPSTYTTKGANGLTLIRSKSDSNILGCVGKGGKIGHVKLNNLIVASASIAPPQKPAFPTIPAPSPVPTAPAPPALPTKKL